MSKGKSPKREVKKPKKVKAKKEKNPSNLAEAIQVMDMGR